MPSLPTSQPSPNSSAAASDKTTALRIACLEPSATAICVALGLAEHIVGITHECDTAVFPEGGACPIRLTRSGLNNDDELSQGAIHAAVQASTTTCLRVPPATTETTVPSLYPLLRDQFALARPTLVFTQDLCAVCAPTRQDVEEAAIGIGVERSMIDIVSLSPTTLTEVAATFVTIATACGVPDRGVSLRTQWETDLARLYRAIAENTSQSKRHPRLLLLEWLDPPFTGGHWTDDMMKDVACIEPARVQPRGSKSTVVSWDMIQQRIQPDAILVGCCGFDLERNVRDARIHRESLTQCTNRIFCCNGNRYMAQPSPTLLQGAAILAKCAYYDQPDVLAAIDALDLFRDERELGYGEDTAWCKLDDGVEDSQPHPAATSRTSCSLPDMEDLLTDTTTSTAEEDTKNGFHRIHKEACDQGLATYEDPATGYSVFTAVAHTNRGWCCGSGCRHCPYNHANVKSDTKSNKIQQPSILYQPTFADDDDEDRLFSIQDHATVKVLFFSGGKDSFLTLRSLARQQQPFGLVLLTTFDATTRRIAHQDILIDQVIRQAQHLRICLVGVPLRRGSGEPYTERIQLGLDVIRKELAAASSHISTLVFGDLHLAHIREWRDRMLPDLGDDYALEYPLWKVPYADLMNDLEASEVPCYISGTSTDGIVVGVRFDRTMFETTTVSLGVDRFGESGEFHSLAEVWTVPRNVALGLPL